MKILTLSDYLKQQFGQKVYKIVLSSGCTCPNRDGTIGTGGCTFCSAGGSGEFAMGFADGTNAGSTGSLGSMGAVDGERMNRAIEEAKRRVSRKFPKNLPPEKRKFIAYFQSYTNTYGDTDRLYRLYRAVLDRPDIVALSVGTRPDCLEDDKIDMLKRLNEVKPVWVELGLQTMHDRTAERLHRGYPTAVFEESYHRLKAVGLTVIVHVILGLPGESREDMLDTVRYLSALYPKLDGIKLQMLNILEGSQLAEEYKRHPFPQMNMEEYCDLVVDCLKLLPEGVVVHRMTGDGPRKLLISPKWVTDKKRVMNMLRKKMSL